LSPSDIGRHPGYYPQVLGLESDGTDTRAGQTARLYLMGISDWEITFDPTDPPNEEDNMPCSNPDIPCLFSLPPKVG
jgi:hypothetical protein